jgi:enolase
LQRFPAYVEAGSLLALQRQVEMLRQELHDLKEEIRKKDQEQKADEARWAASLARLTTAATIMTEAEAEALLTDDALRILQTPLEDE